MEQQLIRFKVTGVVQGVGFRYHTQREALGLGIRGWCANSPDESVHGAAVGERDEIAQFTKFLHKGPRHAHVEAVEIEKIEQPSEALLAEVIGQGARQFEIRRWGE
ncbi:hypothetical protein Q8F55_002230 [Vanrija albida]|uniref:acylphosphatase n=1 Tax=Vanrija albida TaxID=181172 RepID=A0ABR3Q981_9TREE